MKSKLKSGIFQTIDIFEMTTHVSFLKTKSSITIRPTTHRKIFQLLNSLFIYITWWLKAKSRPLKRHVKFSFLFSIGQLSKKSIYYLVPKSSDIPVTKKTSLPLNMSSDNTIGFLIRVWSLHTPNWDHSLFFKCLPWVSELIKMTPLISFF